MGRLSRVSLRSSPTDTFFLANGASNSWIWIFVDGIFIVKLSWYSLIPSCKQPWKWKIAPLKTFSSWFHFHHASNRAHNGTHKLRIGEGCFPTKRSKCSCCTLPEDCASALSMISRKCPNSNQWFFHFQHHLVTQVVTMWLIWICLGIITHDQPPKAHSNSAPKRGKWHCLFEPQRTMQVSRRSLKFVKAGAYTLHWSNSNIADLIMLDDHIWL